MDSKLYGAGNVAKTTVLPAGIGQSPTRWFMTHPPVEERVTRLRSLRVAPVA